MTEEAKANPEPEQEPDVVVIMSPPVYAVLPKEIKDKGKLMGADEDTNVVAMSFPAKDKKSITNELKKLNKWFFNSASIFGG